jgi:hypothetical protein
VVVFTVVVSSALPVGTQAQSQTADPCATLPSNIAVSALLRPILEYLVVYSPTLKAQCGVIATSPLAHVVVSSTMVPIEGCLARATIRRYTTGMIYALIEIPVPTASYAELLAHEFEHVIEQIQGVDLRALARVRASGVSERAPGVYETDRARRQGRRAGDEMRRIGWSRPKPRVPEALVQSAGGMPVPRAASLR